jgi:hypothetical protein
MTSNYAITIILRFISANSDSICFLGVYKLLKAFNIATM